jgi:hypothetical protein
MRPSLGNVDVGEHDARVDGAPRVDAWLLPVGAAGEVDVPLPAELSAHRDGRPRGVVVAVGRRLIGGDVVALGEILRAGVLGRIDINLLDLQSLEDGVAGQAPVVLVGIGIDARPGIDFRARPKIELVGIEPGPVRVGRVDSEPLAAGRRHIGRAALRRVGGAPGVLEPRHADLLELPVAQTIDILGNDRMVGAA